MPSIQQLKKTTENDVNLPYNSYQNKKSSSSVWNKIFLLILLVGCWLWYKHKANIYVIPDNIYETRSTGHFKDLYETPYKKLIWFGPDCPVSAKRKEIINSVLKYSKLDKYYVHRPYLQNSLVVNCPGIGIDCVDVQIMKRCKEMCIILPNSKRIISITEKSMLRKLKKYQNEM